MKKKMEFGMMTSKYFQLLLLVRFKNFQGAMEVVKILITKTMERWNDRLNDKVTYRSSQPEIKSENFICYKYTG